MKIVIAYIPENADGDKTTLHVDEPFDGHEILKVFPDGQPDVDEWVNAYVEDQQEKHPDWKFLIDSVHLEI